MSNARLVYSTDGGDRRREQPRAPAVAPSVPDDGIVRVHRDRSGRKGKVVTVVTGMPGSPDDLKRACAELKRLCGAGGAVKQRAIELQGDHRDRVAERLRALGHRVKLAGG